MLRIDHPTGVIRTRDEQSSGTLWAPRRRGVMPAELDDRSRRSVSMIDAGFDNASCASSTETRSYSQRLTALNSRMKARRAAVVTDHRLTSKARTALAQSSAESTHPHRHTPACRRAHRFAAVDVVDGGKTSVLHLPRAMHLLKLRLDPRLSIEFSIVGLRVRASRSVNKICFRHRRTTHMMQAFIRMHPFVSETGNSLAASTRCREMEALIRRLRGTFEAADWTRQRVHCG
jgi:hypothetical protein